MAAVQHDHIVTIHQVGEDRGVPFLAMQLLKGESLETRLARDTRLPIKDVLRIGCEIADGLSVAHARGLIHRDIKPANIWLEAIGEPLPGDSNSDELMSDDVESESWCYRVKILDFGLVRTAVDSTQLTHTGMLTGTPAYMAPEQASEDPIDQRCDLFSLGCVLYRMVTGELPFRGTKTLTILWALAVKRPTSPKQIVPEIPAAFSDLMMQLLAKSPADRPQTAREVVRRLRSIERETSVAKPNSIRPKRKRLIYAVALTLFAFGAFWFGPDIYRLSTNQGLLTIESDDPDVTVIVKQDEQTATIIDAKSGRTIMLRAGTYRLQLADGNEGLALSTDRFTLERGGKTIVKVRLGPAVISQVRRFEQLPELPYSAAFCLGGRCVISCGGGNFENGQWLPGNDFALRIWDVNSGKLLRRLVDHRGVVNCLAVSPDGRRALSGGGVDDQDFAIRLWDLESGTLLKTLKGHTARILSLVFSVDGRFAFSAGSRRLEDTTCPIRYWDLDSGKEVRQLTGHTDEVRSLSLSADGRILMSGSQDGTARIWDTVSGSEIRRLAMEGPMHLSVCLSPDGRRALTAGLDPDLRLWDVESGMLLRTFHGHTSTWTGGVAFTSDGRRALSGGGDDNTIRLWNMETGQEIARFDQEVEAPYINNKPFSPDGEFALCVGRDKFVRLLKLPPFSQDASAILK